MASKNRAVSVLTDLRETSALVRFLRVAVVALLAIVFCGYLDRSDIKGFGFHYFERFPHKVRQSMAYSRNTALVEQAKRSVTLIDISETTCAPGNPANIPSYPVPRDFHARLVRELAAAGALVVAFDLVFDQPRPEDVQFAAATRDMAKNSNGRQGVLWATIFQQEDDPGSELFLPQPKLLEASPWHGHIHIPLNEALPEVDRVRAVRQFKSGGEKAFSLQAFLLATQRQNDLPKFLETAMGRSVEFGDFEVPLDNDGFFIINYMAPPSNDKTQTAFPPIPYETVLAAANTPGGLKNHALLGSAFWKDKVVIVGDSTTAGNDFRVTTVGPMWGPEIHAHATASLLMASQGRFPLVRETPDWCNFLVIVFLTVVVCYIAATWKLARAALATLVLLVGYALVNVWMFIDFGLSFHLIAPVTSVVLATIGVLTERSLTEEREKKRMHGLLQRYVSPQVAEYLVANPKTLALGGDSVTATVLFSDIRGFTAMSGQLQPKEVLARLNEYFQAMTDVVFKHDGALDKYIGDAIMAHYGTLLRQPDHARRAVATAIDMEIALLELQARWKEQGLPVIDIGIGINTGDMVVGNMGSDQRMDFSVLGDTVNLSSRVEGLNKDLGTRILITAATYEIVKDEIKSRGPLTAHVKGKEADVVVYEVLGWMDKD